MTNNPGAFPSEASAELLGAPLVLPYIRPGLSEELGISLNPFH